MEIYRIKHSIEKLPEFQGVPSFSSVLTTKQGLKILPLEKNIQILAIFRNEMDDTAEKLESLGILTLCLLRSIWKNTSLKPGAFFNRNRIPV
ncbi:hypothetical protein SUGI_1062580 [Cryptomeria japonica]|nr:hypothetical protein SUGI_1062580 [Cryptomeria japonica]